MTKAYLPMNAKMTAGRKALMTRTYPRKNEKTDPKVSTTTDPMKNGKMKIVLKMISLRATWPHKGSRALLNPRPMCGSKS